MAEIEKAQRFKLLEEESAILERIAKEYPRESNEYLALRRAAEALSFALMRQFDNFVAFLEQMKQPLNREEELFLKRLNLKAPEEDEEE